HHRLEDGRAEAAEGDGKRPRHLGFGAALVQIMLLDIVFSLDSVITAVGMAQHVAIMITAVTIAIVVMLVFANKISQFVEKHPTVKMLALAFLLLVGVMLVAEGFGRHIEKGYIYFAMAFSLVVELLNQRASAGARRRREADPPPASSPAGPANGEAGRASASSGSASAGTVALAREPRGRQQESTPPATRSPRPRTGQPSRPR
ncbi:MAG: TerC family protein, partial [Deltaproteobacteria bacterium]|nr:TerC family protein [Deltaproteobacteria bacterium]